MSQKLRALKIFESALALRPDQRSEFLDATCAGDGELLAQVNQLLANTGDSFLATPSSQENDEARLSSPVAARLQTGDLLNGRYEIVEPIGAGGMGEVFRATDTRLNRGVAIKVLGASHLHRADMHERFDREMKSVAGLTHPNIVTLHDLVYDQERSFAVMEYVEGRTLREMIAGGMDWQQAVTMAVGIADGLQAAHAQDVMHRDIKPDNVIVADGGQVKILDFGLARREDPAAGQKITATSALIPGTAPYMSPEQAESRTLTCATDIFSFGTLLFEMLCGANPFQGDSVLDTLRRVTEQPIPNLAEQDIDLPSELSDLVTRMLSREPAARPSADVVGSRLREIINATSNVATTAKPPAKRENTNKSRSAGAREDKVVAAFVPPVTKYASCGDLHIAYQLFGNGPANLVIAPGFISNCDNSWDNPEHSRWLRALGEFARVAVFDKRGTGLSDRVDQLPSMDERMEDVCAVMNAAGFESAAILGISEGGSLASLFAATYPQRCNALILHGSFAKFESWFATEEALKGLFDYIRSAWGSGTSLPGFAPTVADNPDFQRWWGKFERLGANPKAAIDLMRMNSQIDISPILPAIQTPTLVIRRDDDVLIDPEAGDYLAATIPNALLHRSPGADHLPWVSDAVDTEIAAVRDLLQQATSIEPVERVLATALAVVCTDAHRDQIELQVGRFRGTGIRQKKGALLSTFDGPARAVHCAKAVLHSVPSVAIGLHTAEVLLGDTSVSGPGVDLAVEIAADSSGDGIFVSKVVADLVAGAGFQLKPAHKLPVSGQASEIEILRVC